MENLNVQLQGQGAYMSCPLDGILITRLRKQTEHQCLTTMGGRCVHLPFFSLEYQIMHGGLFPSGKEKMHSKNKRWEEISPQSLQTGRD